MACVPGVLGGGEADVASCNHGDALLSVHCAAFDIDVLIGQQRSSVAREGGAKREGLAQAVTCRSGFAGEEVLALNLQRFVDALMSFAGGQVDVMSGAGDERALLAGDVRGFGIQVIARLQVNIALRLDSAADVAAAAVFTVMLLVPDGAVIGAFGDAAEIKVVTCGNDGAAALAAVDDLGCGEVEVAPGCSNQDATGVGDVRSGDAINMGAAALSVGLRAGGNIPRRDCGRFSLVNRFTNGSS